MKVVILAGGLGTRISEESHLRPKPMIEIGGQPILWHIMKIYSYYGFNEFIICCGYKGYMIKEYFADYYLHCSDVTFDFTAGNKMIVHNNISEPWRVTIVDTGLNSQTGARLRKIKTHIGDERFFMTYGDGVSNVNLKELLEFHISHDVCVTLTAVQPGGKFGVMEIDSNSNITNFVEKPLEDGGWINGGFMVLEPEVFKYLSNDDNCIFESAPLEKLVLEGKVSAYCHKGFWQCMDTQRDKWKLEQLWDNGEALWKLWER